MAMGGGPVVVAIVYKILNVCNVVQSISADEFFYAVILSSVLAFVAAGISVVYNIEKLPMFWATLIHFGVLYADYIIIYLVNGWIDIAIVPGFTLIFILGYLMIWTIVWLSIRMSMKKMNENLKSL